MIEKKSVVSVVLPLGVATIIIFIFVLLICVICVFSCHGPLNLLLSRSEHALFDVCSDLSAFCAHKGETDTDECVHVLTLKNSIKVLHPVAYCK